MNKELQAQIEATGQLDILGYFVWYSLRNVCVSRTVLETQFADKGLPSDWLIPRPTFDTAFNKAIAKNNRALKGEEGVIFRPILKNNDKTVIGVVKEKADKDLEELSYEQ